MNGNNKGRVLTLRVTITDPEKASWIWKSHLEDDNPHGVKVGAIANDNIFKQRDKFEEVLERIFKEYDDDFIYDIQDELDEFEKEVYGARCDS